MGQAETKGAIRRYRAFLIGERQSFFIEGKTRRAETLYDLPSMRAKKRAGGESRGKEKRKGQSFALIGRKTAALPMADKTRRPADGIKEPGAMGGDKAEQKDPMYGGDKGVNKILNVRI